MFTPERFTSRNLDFNDRKVTVNSPSEITGRSIRTMCWLFILGMAIFAGSGCSSEAPPVPAPAPPPPPVSSSATAAPAAPTPKADGKAEEKEPEKDAKTTSEEVEKSQFQIAFSDDGHFAATGGKNATVRLYNVDLGVLTRTFAGHNAAVSAIVFNRDATMVAAGSVSGQLLLWPTLASEGLDEVERQLMAKEERRKLGGHTGAIRSLAFSADGRQLASGGEDGLIHYWQLPVMRPNTLWANPAGIVIVESVPKNDMIVAGSKDGSLEAWDLITARTVALLPANSHQITALTCSQDGAFAAAGDRSGRVRVVELTARKLVMESSVHQGAVTGIKFHPKLHQLVSIGADGKTCVTDLKQSSAKAGEKVVYKPQSKGRIFAVSHSGKQAAIPAGGSVEVADLVTGATLFTLSTDGNEVVSVAWAANDQALIAGDAKGRLLSWRMPEGQRLLESQYHEGAVRALAGNAHQPEIVSGGADGKLSVWNQPGIPEIIVETVAVDPSKLSVSPEGKRVACGTRLGGVQVFDVKERSLIGELPITGSPIVALAWSLDGDWLASGDESGLVRAWQVLKSSDSIVGLKAGAAVTHLAFHPNGPTLMAATKNGEFRSWKAPFQNKQTLTGNTDAVTSLLSLRTGLQVITGGSDGVCRLFDGATGKPLRMFEGAKSGIIRMTKSADETLIAAATLDGATAWSSATGETLGSAYISDADVTAIALNPSNKMLASGSNDGMIRFWQLPMPPVVEMKEPPRKTTTLALSPDGTRVALGRSDHSISIRDTVTGTQLQMLTGHTGDITALAWSKDSSFVISGSQDKTVGLWDPANGKRLVKWEGHSAAARAVALSEDNDVLSACNADARFVKYARSTKQEKELLSAQQAVTAIGLSATGKRLAWAAADGTLQLVDGETGEAILKNEVEDVVSLLSFCPDEESWVSVGSTRKVSFWKLELPDPNRGWDEAHAGLTKLSISADGMRLLGNAEDGTMRLWDARGKVLQSFPWDKVSIVQAMALSNDGKMVVAGGSDGRTAAFRSSLIKIIKAHEGRVDAIGFLDENLMVSAGEDQKIPVWNLANGTKDKDFEGCPATPVEMLVVPKASKLILLASDNRSYAWNLETGERLNMEPGLNNSLLKHMGVHPDEDRVVFLDDRGQARIVSLTDLREVNVIASSVASATAITMVSDGSIACAGGNEAYVIGDEVATTSQDAHKGAMIGIAINGNKDEFFTAGVDGVVKAWSGGGKTSRTIAKVDGSARSFALSPDGAEFILLTTDGKVRCFSHGGEKLGEWIANPRPDSIEFAGRATHAVVTSSSKQFRLSPSVSGKMFAMLTASGNVSVSAVSSDENAIYTATDDGKLLRYELGPSRSVASDQREVESVRLSESGEFFASGGKDTTVGVWKTQKLTSVCRLKGHTKPVTSVVFGRDESLVVSASQDKTVRIWNAQKSKNLFSIAVPGIPLSLSIANEDRAVAVAIDDKTLPTFDMRSGKATDDAAVGSGSIVQAYYTPRGIVALFGDRRICTWESETSLKPKQFATESGPPTSLDVLGDKSYYFVAGPQLGVKLFDFTGQESATFETTNIAYDKITASFDGAWLAGGCPAGSNENLLTIWNVSDRKVVSSISLEKAIRSVRFEAEAGVLLAVCDDHKMHRFRASDGVALETMDLIADPTTAPAMLTNGEVCTVEADGRARLYSPAAVHVQEAHTGPVTSLVYSADGSLVFSGGADGRIVGWGVDRQKTVVEYNSGTSNVNEIHLTADQRSLIATSEDGGVRVWMLGQRSTEPDFVLPHKRPVRCARSSQDGALLVSGGADQIVHLWVLPSRREAVQFHGHEGTIARLVISQDKKSIISFGEEDSVRVWKIPEDALNPPKDPSAAVKISQINESAGTMAVTQPQDREIASLERQLTMNMAIASKGGTQLSVVSSDGAGAKGADTGKSSEAIEKAKAEDLERRLSALRAGESAQSLAMPEVHGIDSELRQLEMRMRGTPPGASKEKMRLEWRRMKRQKELEDRLAFATGAEQKAIREELAALGFMDPRKIKLNEDEAKTVPGIDIKPLQSFKTDYVFDFESFHPVKLAFSRDLKTIAAGRESAVLSNNRVVHGMLQLWDVETGVHMKTWREVENRRVGLLLFTPDEQFIYALPDVTVFQISSGTSRSMGSGECSAVTKDGSLIAVGIASPVLTDEKIIRLIDANIAQFRPQKVDDYESKVTALTFSASGKSLYASIRGRLRHRLAEFDVQTMSQIGGNIEEVRYGEPWHQGAKISGIEAICVSQDDKYLVVYGRYSEDEFRLSCWIKQDGKWVVRKGFVFKSDRRLLRPGSPPRMWMVHDTPVMCMEDAKGSIVFVDLQTGQTVTKDLVATHWGMPETAYSDDGAWYVSGDDSGRLYIWDLKKQELFSVFRAHSGPVVGIALSSGGTHILSAGEENVLKIWNRSSLPQDSIPKSTGPKPPRPAVTTKPRPKN